MYKKILAIGTAIILLIAFTAMGFAIYEKEFKQVESAAEAADSIFYINK